MRPFPDSVAQALKHPGFFRTDALPSVLVVTDADELPSAIPASAAQLAAVHGRYTVIGAFGSSTPSCNETLTAGTGANALTVAMLDGVGLDLCAPSWDATFDTLLTRAVANARYTLAADVDGPITVEVNGVVVLSNSGSIWSYDPATRQLVFQPSFWPAPNSTVRVTYSSACH
jgi:hypothetical protein